MKLISMLCVVAALGRADWPTRGVFFNGAAYTHGVRYRFATVVEPPGSDRHWGNGIGSGFRYRGGKEHRILWDTNSHVFFGYDLAVERADNSGRCRVTISPLTLTMDDVSLTPVSDAASYKPLSLATYPTPQMVHSDDTIALDLLTSPDGKQKVVDYIQVGCKEAAADRIGGTAVGAPAARDFTVQDFELRLVEPRLTINDRPVETQGLHAETIGGVVWLQIPGKGRFLLTLAPYPSLGFRQAGTMQGSEITFRYGGDRYRIHSAEPLFRSEQPWNVYVRADESRQSGQGVTFGAADRPEHILTSH